MWSDWLVFCDYGFSVSALWCPLTTPTILLGFLLPWTWGISSQLLQQSTASAPYLGRGISLHCHPSWPWIWSSFCAMQPLLSAAATQCSRYFSDQCKEIEENNRMGKTRDLFKTIWDIKGTFHAKMGSIKDRNGMYLTEAEDIKRWQEYTEELYKKDLHDPENHDGVITHLEPNILKCKGDWALGSSKWPHKPLQTKLGGGYGIPAELFQIIKDDASKFGKLSSGHRTGNVSFHFNPKERQCQRMLTLPHNCTHLTSKVM